MWEDPGQLEHLWGVTRSLWHFWAILRTSLWSSECGGPRVETGEAHCLQGPRREELVIQTVQWGRGAGRGWRPQERLDVCVCGGDECANGGGCA